NESTPSPSSITDSKQKQEIPQIKTIPYSIYDNNNKFLDQEFQLELSFDT
ncbi:6512_t:CDS:2, partial [Gigaspora rosea]